ncbi:MAG: hypothetical protein ACYDBB_19250 [Armatimonadota bacterium]
MQNDDYVLIFETMSQVELSICRQMLEETGISTVEQRVIDPWVSNVMRQLVAPRLVLLVRRADAEKAAEVVEDFRQHAATTEAATHEEEETEVKPPHLKALYWARVMIWIILLAVAAFVIFAVVMAVTHR